MNTKKPLTIYKSDIISSSSRCRSIHNILYNWASKTQNIYMAGRISVGIPSSHIKARYSQYSQECGIDNHEYSDLIHLGSYNYSALNGRQEILQAAKEAINEFGTTTSGVRILNGTNELHIALEKKLASFLGVEDVITYSSGYLANMSVLSALCSDQDVVFSDALNHQSIVDGLKLSGAKVIKFNHKDYAELEALLNKELLIKRKFIISDGIFSMDGDVARLDLIVELAEKYGAYVIIDDAHATAAYGPNGRGTPAHYALEKKVDILTGSLSKGLPGIGGFAAGSKKVIDFLRFGSNGYIFSASIPGSISAALIQAINILENEPLLQEKLHKNARYFREKLSDMGLNVMQSESAIIPILLPNRNVTVQFAAELHKVGVYANCVTFPAVPRKLPRIRINMGSSLTQTDLDFALAQIHKVACKLGIITKVQNYV